jgi:hypothetical protein
MAVRVERPGKLDDMEPMSLSGEDSSDSNEGRPLIEYSRL